MKKQYSLIPLYLGALIFIVSLFARFFIWRVFIFSFGVFAGLALIAYGTLNFCINSGYFERSAEILRRSVHILLILVAVSFVIIEVIIISGSRTDVDYREDYVIILGAGLNGRTPSLAMQTRIQGANEYLKKNPKATVIACGGMGADELITEAQAIQTALMETGVSKKRILLDNTSRNTNENMANAARLIAEDCARPVRVALVTNDFHIWRSKFLARKYGLNASGYSVETPLFLLKIQYYLREYFSVIKAVLGF